MRQFIRKNIIKALPVLMLGSVGCNKFQDTNVNPAATVTPKLANLLSNVEANIGGYATSTTTGLFCQYFSETQYNAASLYASSSLLASFSSNYYNYLMDLQDIINRDGGKNMNAVAKILQAYIFWYVTDMWGDVPYSQALKGTTSLKPAFDTQETIYKGLIQQLTDAVGSFDATAPLITGDFIYSGDISSWKKMANSLRMMMALRLTKRYPAASDYAATQFKAALADGGGYMTANSENFKVTYDGDKYKSPWYNLYDGRKDVGQSKTITDMLAGYGDNRQTTMGSSTQGVPYGLARVDAEAWATANPNWSRILAATLRPTGGVVTIVTASEVTLARAEAADRGWTTEDALNLYKQGITLSFEQWGAGTPASTYFDQTGVAFTAATGTGANLKQIATQRWLATYPDGVQGWSEWRRTGFPVLTPAVAATNTSKLIPRRYTYATVEYNTNGDNVTAAAGRLEGGDTQDSKFWWDK